MSSAYKEYGYSDESPTYSHSYLYSSLLQMLNPSTNRVILDVGCGNGYIAAELIKLGYEVYGIDASVEGIKIANNTCPDHFFVMDISQGDLPDQIKHKKFDTIISTEVIEHLYDPKSYIKFCYNILEQNGSGEIIISTPYHGYFKNLLFGIIGVWDRHFTVLWDGGHIKFWSKKTLTSLLEENNFRVKEFLGSGRLPFLWKSMFIKATFLK